MRPLPGCPTPSRRPVPVRSGHAHALGWHDTPTSAFSVGGSRQIHPRPPPANQRQLLTATPSCPSCSLLPDAQSIYEALLLFIEVLCQEKCIHLEPFWFTSRTDHL